jgi:hypothetical protein
MTTATHADSADADLPSATPDSVSDPAPPASRWYGGAVVVGGFFAARIALWATGTRFSLVSLEYPSLWHLLDPAWLKSHPLGPIWDQHTQPPVFNTFVGLVLRWSPFPDGISFQLLYLAFGLASALALNSILRQAGCRWWIAAAVTVVVFSDPIVIRYEHQLTYECLVSTLLLGSIWAALRYATAPNLRWLGAFLAVATTLVLTRAVFHPLWLVVGTGILLVLRPPRADWRHMALVAALPLVLVVGLMAKNEARFGTFSLSSWFGMNLDRMMVDRLSGDEKADLIDDGVMSPQAVVPPFSSYDEYEPYVEDCSADHGSAALDAPRKEEGTINFNYACFVPVYDQAQSDALGAIREKPGVYVGLVRGALVTFLADEPNDVVGDSGPVTVLDGIHDTLAVEVSATADYRDIALPKRIHLTSLASLLALVVAGLWAAVRALRGDRSLLTVGLVFVGFTVAFATAASIGFELWENARFRVPLDPLLFGAVLAAPAELLARRFLDRPGGVGAEAGG